MGGGLKHCSAQGNLPAPKASEIIDLCNYPKPSYPAEQKPAPSNQIHGLQDGFSDEVIIVDLIDASPPKKQNYVGKPTTGQLPGGSAVIVIDD